MLVTAELYSAIYVFNIGADGYVLRATFAMLRYGEESDCYLISSAVGWKVTRINETRPSGGAAC